MMLFKNCGLSAQKLYGLLIIPIILIVLILMALLYSSITYNLRQQQADINNFAHALQLRIDRYRFVTWQAFDSLSQPEDAAITPDRDLPTESPNQSEIYRLDTHSESSQTLIFGTHEARTSRIAARLSGYMDILWGSSKLNWTMYYLNGQDNSLSVVSTQPINHLMGHYQGSHITSLINSRRNEMLQQANMLDQRESFSGLRTSVLVSNDHYMTMGTTFNQPGHLTTILAFDLPVSDLAVSQLRLADLQFHTEDSNSSGEHSEGSVVNLSALSIDLQKSLANAPLTLIYQVPMWGLLQDAMISFLPAYLLILLLLSLAVMSRKLVRREKYRQDNHQDPETEVLRQLNREIIHQLPLGYLIYDIQKQAPIIANPLAEHLIPHLNLKSLLQMSQQPYELIQVTINNEMYEIRQLVSEAVPDFRLLIIREQERELLVNKKLQRAQLILDDTHQLRRKFFRQLTQTLSQPLTLIRDEMSAGVSDKRLNRVRQHFRRLDQLIDNISLLNQLESGLLKPEIQPFTLQDMLDNTVSHSLNAMTERGITLLVDNPLPVSQTRLGAAELLHKLLTTLLTYSAENTVWGKITVKLHSTQELTDRVIIGIVDTGPGLSPEEIDNADFPFISPVSALHPDKSGSMDLFICKQLTIKLNGTLDIVSNPRIGTSYQLSLELPVVADNPLHQEPLMEGITVLLDIVAEDIRQIISRQLEQWGAKCYFPEDRYSGQHHDLMITDAADKLTDWGILLNAAGQPELNDRQRYANISLSASVLEALLSLIEKKLTTEELDHLEQDEPDPIWKEPEYFQMFRETVPDDIIKLYNELNIKDYAALALTAHRLKGVFAMLNLTTGHALCEQLEEQIQQHSIAGIKNRASQLEQHVKILLQKGSLTT